MLCLFLALQFCLQSHTRWSCCMIPLQTLKSEVQQPAFKTSVSSTSWVVAVTVPGGLQTALSFDPSPCRDTAASTLSSAELWSQLCAAPHGQVTPLSCEHTCAHVYNWLLSCCFSHLLAHHFQHSLLTTYLTLPHLASPKKHGKKSYL